MGLSHEHVGSTIPAKINTYMLTRAELLIHLCYETPCSTHKKLFTLDTGKILKEKKLKTDLST